MVEAVKTTCTRGALTMNTRTDTDLLAVEMPSPEEINRIMAEARAMRARMSWRWISAARTISSAIW